MSGKPYSISEFKMIVDYIVENKLYGETKAKKMWVDFANTKLTTRTWQSLKETYLKRVLPDIHNPYFKLSNEQISSFRSRCDLADRNKNKLEVHSISDDSNSNGSKDIDPSNNGNIDEGETNAGENIKCSKIPQQSRSSADTVILENCYETAEDIQKDLESNGDKLPDMKPAALGKSLRDCITYSEPLTPMLQEVLDDFASEPEDSDKESQMQIVESIPENDTDDHQVPKPNTEIPSTKKVATDVAKNAKGLSAEVVEEVLAQELDGSGKSEKKSNKKTQNLKSEAPKIPVLPVVNLDEEISSMQAENGTENNDDINTDIQESTKPAEDTENPVIQDSENTEVPDTNNSNSEPKEQSGGLNTSNSTVDASLPNNPEALKNKNPSANKAKINDTVQSEVQVQINSTKSQSRLKLKKRSSSVDTLNNVENKKKKLKANLKSPSDTDQKADTESHINKNAAEGRVKEKDQSAIEMGPDQNKPSTNHDNNEVQVIATKNNLKSPVIKNPCLENISLFDEQFNKTKHNMSESSDTELNKKEIQGTHKITVSKATDDIVVLKSHTDSDSEPVISPPKKKNRAGVLSTKTERDKAIANMFGFTSGGVGSKRKRQLSRRRRTISHNNASHKNAAVSNSSDWTSDSESEFISPPRSRRNRVTRKYLKPKAGKITSLEEEGGLFIMYGKKIYPIIKDGKIVKNYLTYLPESESEEEKESYWKLKYVEEKKKAAELKKLLDKAKEPLPSDASPTAQAANPLRNSRSSESQTGQPSNGVGNEICIPGPEEKKEPPKVNPTEKIKIKFTKNNEEVHLEGLWPQIHPVLEQVVQIFHKESEPPISERKSKMLTERPKESNEPCSGNSTPIIITPMDPEVHEKVDKIEKEIFKEIEERDKEEQDQPNEIDTNVTKRKIGRPRKSSSSVSQSPSKKPKLSDETGTKASEENRRSSRQKTAENENKAADNKETASGTQIRTPRKVLNETVNTNQSKTIQTRRSKQNLDTSKNNDDEEVRYMFPPKTRRQSLLAAASKKNNQKQKSAVKYPKIFSSPDNFSLNSMDSTQGYQDSDVSLVKTELRKRKKLDITSFTLKTRNSLRRSLRKKNYPYLYCNAYNDSSCSSIDATVEKVVRDNSSLNSEAYKTESYQLLMPRAKVSLRQLEPIDESTPIGNDTYFVKSLESMCTNEIVTQTNNSGLITSDVGSSSNVSLPMSPELSVVENMSVSKDIVNSIEDYPTINEMQNNETNEPTLCDKYMISDVDVSVPLMEQECEFKSCNTITDISSQPKDLVTESLLNKIGTFNINEEVTPTDTLDKKLHDLLLESAKKLSQGVNCKESMMEVDDTNVEAEKKSKPRKRCSTPRKRKGSKKSAAPSIDPVVEEEHVESCSHSGRKSCPPLLQTYTVCDDVDTEEINLPSLTNEKPKAKKKKDIIRVKIQRPKNKKSQEKARTKSTHNASRVSVFTDSGINDTESEVFIPMNESVDLIHNHSETCLHANDCVGDSIEFVENSKSVITLGDSMQSGDNAWNSTENENSENISPDLFCNNAQDVSFYTKTNSDNIENTSDTVYHSPLGTEESHNSMITEDLSDDPLEPPPRSSKWYLLSEDETTNTNMVGQGSAMLSSGGFGSNLKQLFPITCAIPDLSTISEISRENDNSRKPTFDIDGLTGDDFNSQSVFDSNF